ncbi:Uncharacterised protein [Mycobacteroides abscessus subsp. abscessus]|nr:Uncharacterised protein [Mycobacteroides abscessus subsp. abscessus]
MDDVEHHLALADRNGEVDELTAIVVASPDPQVCVVAHVRTSFLGALLVLRA